MAFNPALAREVLVQLGPDPISAPLKLRLEAFAKPTVVATSDAALQTLWNDFVAELAAVAARVAAIDTSFA